LAQVQAATLCLINLQRGAHGESPLNANSRLGTAAARHSADMVAENYFEHTSPSGQTFIDRLTAAGYITPRISYSAGENIATGTGAESTPAAMVAAWMNSPEHRANILDADFTDTGIGVVAGAPASIGGGRPGGTYTEDFGVVTS
jgi:uncharacterized protein YkwD